MNAPDLIKTFHWQSRGATILGHRNESLRLLALWERERQAQARCDRENEEAA